MSKNYRMNEILLDAKGKRPHLWYVRSHGVIDGKTYPRIKEYGLYMSKKRAIKEAEQSRQIFMENLNHHRFNGGVFVAKDSSFCTRTYREYNCNEVLCAEAANGDFWAWDVVEDVILI